jgi:hypothetical protein
LIVSFLFSDCKAQGDPSRFGVVVVVQMNEMNGFDPRSALRAQM